MDWTLIIGFIGMTIGLFVNIPQAITIYKRKSSVGVAVWTYRLLLIVVTCYLIRAIAIREIVFIVSNSLSVCVTTAVLILIRRYK